jgi:hypothetical protein
MPQPVPPTEQVVLPVDVETPPAAPAPTLADRLERPRARVVWRHGRLMISLPSKRSELVDRLQVVVRWPDGKPRRRFIQTTRRAVWRLPSPPRTVSLRNVPFEGDDLKPSAALTLGWRGGGIYR